MQPLVAITAASMDARRYARRIPRSCSASCLNRIEAQFKALRHFTLNGTDHPDHATRARLIRR